MQFRLGLLPVLLCTPFWTAFPQPDRIGVPPDLVVFGRSPD